MFRAQKKPYRHEMINKEHDPGGAACADDTMHPSLPPQTMSVFIEAGVLFDLASISVSSTVDGTMHPIVGHGCCSRFHPSKVTRESSHLNHERSIAWQPHVPHRKSLISYECLYKLLISIIIMYYGIFLCYARLCS